MTTSEINQTLRALSSLWWLLALFGLATLGLGIFFVASPHETLSTFTVVAGIFLLIDGLVAIAGSVFGSGESRGLFALVGVLSAIAGLVLIKQPFHTLTVFALVFGVWLIVAGGVRGMVAVATPENRGGNLALAAIDLIAGVVILSWPHLGLTTLAVLIGITLIVRGMLLIAAGVAVRSVGGAVELAD